MHKTSIVRRNCAGYLHGGSGGRPCDADVSGDAAAEVLQHQHRAAHRHEGRALRLRLLPQLHAAALRGAAEREAARLAEPHPLLHRPPRHQHRQQGPGRQVPRLLKVTFILIFFA